MVKAVNSPRFFSTSGGGEFTFETGLVETVDWYAVGCPDFPLSKADSDFFDACRTS